MAKTIKRGDLVPLTMTLHNSKTDKVVTANIYRDDTSAGMTLNSALITLTHNTLGTYTDNSFTATGQVHIRAVYRIFESDGSTTSIDTEVQVEERFDLADAFSNINARADVIGLVDASVTVIALVDQSVTVIGLVK